MNQSAHNLFWEIINCPNSCLDDCKNFIKAAQNIPVTNPNFQLPEPWNGDIDNAKIIFFGANPGYTFEEDYPNYSWGKGDVENFFVNRFSATNSNGKQYVQVPTGINEKKDYPNLFKGYEITGNYQILLKTNLIPTKGKVNNINGVNYKDLTASSYWASIYKMAYYLSTYFQFCLPSFSEPNYLITEVCHCKSQSTKVDGFSAACKSCNIKYTQRILKCAKKAKVIVAVGGDAVRNLNAVGFPLVKTYFIGQQVKINNRNYWYIAVPHPSSSILGKDNFYQWQFITNNK